MHAPRFSVVMPVLNGEQFIDSAIESVLAQSYGDFELLVSDNCSTDSTVERVSRFLERDSRVCLLRRTEQGSPGLNRNFAISHARADWISLIDADDIWPSDHLALCDATINARPEVVMLFGDYRRFSQSIEFAGSSVLDGQGFFNVPAPYVREVVRTAGGVELFCLDQELLKKHCCIYYCPISTQTVTLRHETMRQGRIGFHDDWLINEDFHAWMQMLEAGSAVAVRSVLAYYRHSPGSLTSDPIRYLEGMAVSHGHWMNRIRPSLTLEELHAYRDKVAGFLHSVAWTHSRRGRIAAAAGAQLRSLRVRCQPTDLIDTVRTVFRATYWRLWALAGRRLPDEDAL